MASRVPTGPLSEEAIRGLVEAANAPGSSLPQVHLVIEGEPILRALCSLVRVRAGGFMVAVPLTPEVEAFFLEEDVDEQDRQFGLSQQVVEFETTRGRSLGAELLLLVDVPWDRASLFSRVSTLRGDAARALVRFSVNGTVARPVQASLLDAAAAWITSQMDEDTAGEYATADEALPGDQDLAMDGVPATGPELHVEGDRLQGQVLALQEELRKLRLERAQGSGLAGGSGEPMLGRQPQAALGPGVMEKLRMMAGGAPARLGQHERQVRLASPHLTADTAQQEIQLGATEDEDLEAAITASLEDLQDPVHRLLALQMKQNAMLAKQLKSKQVSDPLAAVLMPQTETGGSSSGGMKGCLARDAYVKVMLDLTKVAQVAEENALAEMGLEVGGAYPGLMRDYVEKRMALADLRQMTQFGYLMAAAWESGFRLQNRELQAWAAKALIYIEQSAIDNGRTQMGWLLTGLAEPNYQLVQKNRQRVGLRPFARLASPAWISANVSYMRDLDFIEQKLKTSGTGKDKDDDKEKDKPPKKFPPKKGKGRAKGEDATTTEAE